MTTLSDLAAQPRVSSSDLPGISRLIVPARALTPAAIPLLANTNAGISPPLVVEDSSVIGAQLASQTGSYSSGGFVYGPSSTTTDPPSAIQNLNSVPGIYSPGGYLRGPQIAGIKTDAQLTTLGTLMGSIGIILPMVAQPGDVVGGVKETLPILPPAAPGTGLANDGGVLMLEDMSGWPTSDAGLPVGSVWNNNGVVAFVRG